ncbi:MAG: aminoacyl-tRNA hydrolase [Verrucomicrobiota bacterium]
MQFLGLIVGLGNPGEAYRETRHNAGFMVVDRLAGRYRAGWRVERKFFAEVAEVDLGPGRVRLCKPQTFMNASGESVGPLARFHRVPAEQVLVVSDDADLPLGTLRLRPGGSSGGHHGLWSVEQHLGSRGFLRQRVGIARPAQAVRDIAGHVLGRFGADERDYLDRVLDRAVRQIEAVAREGPARAMNLYNGTVEGPSETRKE